MSLGVFVEGDSDEKAICTLLRKLGRRSVHPGVVRRGNMFDVDKMAAHIAALRGRHPSIERVLIFLDSECTDPDATLQETEQPQASLRKMSPVPVDYLVVDHSIEGWLLQDKALRGILGKGATVRVKGSTEEECRPALKMRRIFRDNGKEFHKVLHNPELAKAVSAKTLEATDPTFRRLVELVKRAG